MNYYRYVTSMALNPFQLLGALVAACVVLALAKVVKPIDPQLRYGLRSLIMVMTIAALILGVISVILHS
jgi:hypothetical protein